MCRWLVLSNLLTAAQIRRDAAILFSISPEIDVYRTSPFVLTVARLVKKNPKKPTLLCLAFGPRTSDARSIHTAGMF